MAEAVGRFFVMGRAEARRDGGIDDEALRRWSVGGRGGRTRSNRPAAFFNQIKAACHRVRVGKTKKSPSNLPEMTVWNGFNFTKSGGGGVLIFGRFCAIRAFGHLIGGG